MADHIKEPLPIFRQANRYLIFDVHAISHLRCAHNICGVLIGNIPCAAQQNVFSGIPLELMPEEARLLLEKGIVYVVDDVRAHAQMSRLGTQAKSAFLEEVMEKRVGAAVAARRIALGKKNAHFEKARRGEIKQRGKGEERKADKSLPVAENAESADDGSGNDNLLFGSPEPSSILKKSRTVDSGAASVADVLDRPLVPHDYTPTMSYPPLVANTDGALQEIPEATNAYHLFAHLHSKGYFMSPGLRFGCQFVAYPGDPLRFHSHFLSVSKDWNEPIDLIDIVGGGRLGTGVKKGYLLGGLEEEEGKKQEERKVRTFCFEWAAM